ncbi:MAG TPA: TolC family protein [Verrucomicrobiae bacterium]
MSILRILFVLVGMGSVALAQTNAPSQVRRLTLQECIELALTNNLQLQIDRYNPQIALYGVKQAYGGYDPVMNLSGQHDHRESGTQILGGAFTIGGSATDDNSFSGALNGLTPIGTTYGLQINTADTYGSTPTTMDDPTRPLFRTTNIVYDVEGGTNKTIVTTSYAQIPGQRPFENSTASAGFTVSQPLLKNFWIDSTRLTIRVAKNRLKYSEQGLRQQIMQTLTAVEQAYYELIYTRESLLVQQKAVELAERLVMENRKRLEVGALAPLDLQSAEAQAASTRAAVIAAKSQLDTQERLVKSLITDRYQELWANIPLEPAGSLTAPVPVLNLQDSWSKGLSMRPEILQAKLDIERQGIQLKYDRNQLLPQLDVFGTYGYNGTGKEFSDAFYDVQSLDRRYYSYGGRISVPLFNLSAKNAHRSDKATMQQLVLGLKQLEQNTLILIDNDIGNIRANYDQVQATRAARQYQEAALDAEQKKLENGKSTTYTVLQVQRDLTAARGNEIQALDAYNKSLSQLSLHEGSTLERLGVKLDVK